MVHEKKLDGGNERDWVFDFVFPFLPQLLAERTGCVLKFVGLNDEEGLDMEEMKALVGPRTKLISVQHVSNTLGCVNPTAEIVALARGVGAKVLLDCCQSVPHMPVDVQVRASFLLPLSWRQRELGCFRGSTTQV